MVLTSCRFDLASPRRDRSGVGIGDVGPHPAEEFGQLRYLFLGKAVTETGIECLGCRRKKFEALAALGGQFDYLHASVVISAAASDKALTLKGREVMGKSAFRKAHVMREVSLPRHALRSRKAQKDRPHRRCSADVREFGVECAIDVTCDATNEEADRYASRSVASHAR